MSTKTEALIEFEQRCEAAVLVRNHDTVHVRGCRVTDHIKDPITPWIWPEGKTRAEVWSASENGLSFCRVCQPLTLVPVTI